MSTQLRALRIRPGIPPRRASAQGTDRVSVRGRILQATLAVYLIPALLVVLLVGGIGLLILAVGQAVGWIARAAAGPDSSSS
jgi:hypothetical protein